MAEPLPDVLAPGIRQTRLLERAVRERWPIDELLRDAIIKRQVSIAIDPKSSPREATSAARCLVQMDALNLQKLDDELRAEIEKIIKEREHEANGHGGAAVTAPVPASGRDLDSYANAIDAYQQSVANRNAAADSAGQSPHTPPTDQPASTLPAPG